MSVTVMILLIAALFFEQLFHRRKMAEILRSMGEKEKKRVATRHISPHRKALEKQRRINK